MNKSIKNISLIGKYSLGIYTWHCSYSFKSSVQTCLIDLWLTNNWSRFQFPIKPDWLSIWYKYPALARKMILKRFPSLVTMWDADQSTNKPELCSQFLLKYAIDRSSEFGVVWFHLLLSWFEDLCYSFNPEPSHHYCHHCIVPIVLFLEPAPVGQQTSLMKIIIIWNIASQSDQKMSL